MQNEIVCMGLMIKQIIPNFNTYEGAQMIANRGQMMILKTTERTAPVYTGEFIEALYTGELKRSKRIYRCQQCHECITVGVQGVFTTIEYLKDSGCPCCGHRSFDLVEKRKLL
jgi:N4-bis(aminopropyl)spermidine synthase